MSTDAAKKLLEAAEKAGRDCVGTEAICRECRDTSEAGTTINKATFDLLRVADGMAEALEQWKRHVEMDHFHHCVATCFYPGQQALAEWERLWKEKP
jgi:hypothetical protein